ncbi:alcohol dehydrogenase catalytic domain-containing protein [Arcticibacter svalbardensis]|uniref:alcohol dehydrogenase catalytic domain-containing protein n=1 Tax=Arcticibacter svalbardensis TaxID=1288027 RepID=UPI001F16C3B5|nr:alcohol dehydrogenase catalytic domain-containing protein [Arcticibacter svalbardensis]
MEGDNAAGFKKGESVTFIPYFYCGECVACRSDKTNCCASIKVCGLHIDGEISFSTLLLLQGNGLSFDELALVEPISHIVYPLIRLKNSFNLG